MKVYIAILALSLMAGCSGGGSDNKGGGGGGAVPGDIDFKVDASETLNDQQLREVQAYMKTDSAKFPGSDTLYNPDSDSQKRKKQKKLDKLNGEGRTNLQIMKNNCDVQDRKERKISGPEENTMPKAGDVTVTEVTSSISGRNCPIAHADKNSLKKTVLDFNYDEKTRTLNRMLIRFEGSSTTNNEMRTRDFIRLNNNRVRMSAEMSVNGTMDMSQKASAAYMKALGSGTIESENGLSVPMRFEVESLRKSEGENTSGKSATKMVLKFPSFNLIVQGLEELANNTTTQKFFVNGRELTAQEFENLVGGDLSMNSLSQSEE